jgi:hypothetical protein
MTITYETQWNNFCRLGNSLLHSLCNNQQSDVIMLAFFSPGQYVKHPQQPDWGIGQVQSCVADRITVNFEHAGKQLIIASVIELVTVSEEDVRKERN